MIIGISGQLVDARGRTYGTRGSGKDAVASLLLRHYGFERIAFADPMKIFAREIFGFTELQLNGPSAEREKYDPRWDITPRHALQTLGTEWGRALHPDLWVRYAMRRAHGIIDRGEAAGVVLTDLRFPNEVDCVRAAGGVVVRVKRPKSDAPTSWLAWAWQRLRDVLRPDRASVHPSERALDHLRDGDFDFVIENSGTLDDLDVQVRRMMGEPLTK